MVTKMETPAAAFAAATDAGPPAEPPGSGEPAELRGLRGLTLEPGALARWRTCLHEAGHAVAGSTLLKRTVRAAVYHDNLGAAYLDIDGVPRTFNEALAVAAGPAAEALAEFHAPPPVPHPPPLTVSHPPVAAPLVAQLRRESLPDAVAIARWCIAGIEGQPDRWAKRHGWINREARFFVGRHQQKIVDAAGRLFANCVITLPGETERKSSPGDLT